MQRCEGREGGTHVQIWEGAFQAEGMEGQRSGGGTIPGLFEGKVGCVWLEWQE